MLKFNNYKNKNLEYSATFVPPNKMNFLKLISIFTLKQKL